MLQIVTLYYFYRNSIYHKIIAQLVVSTLIFGSYFPDFYHPCQPPARLNGLLDP